MGMPQRYRARYSRRAWRACSYSHVTWQAKNSYSRRAWRACSYSHATWPAQSSNSHATWRACRRAGRSAIWWCWIEPRVLARAGLGLTRYPVVLD